MGESKSRIEPVTCPDCGVRGEVRLAQSGFKNNFPNVVQCKHRQGMAVVTCPSLRPEIDAGTQDTAKASKTHQRASRNVSTGRCSAAAGFRRNLSLNDAATWEGSMADADALHIGENSPDKSPSSFCTKSQTLKVLKCGV